MRLSRQTETQILDLQPSFPLAHALSVIRDTYGAVCYYKPKTLSKFGRFETLGTSYETVQEQGGSETYLTDNLIDTVVSSNAGDTQIVGIEGHTIDGSGNLTFVAQNATLNGTTNVTLTTPLARSARIVNRGSASFAGTVKVIDADAPSVIYVQAGGTYNRSQKAATSISQIDYWVITAVSGYVEKKTTAQADFSLQQRLTSGVTQELFGFTTASASPGAVIKLDPPIIIPSNSDVAIAARASTTNVEVIARIDGYLALRINPNE